MKFSQTLQAQSDPQWAPYNLDYIELKKLIKLYTTKKTCQGITIPGHADASLEKLEKVFQAELSHQYDRIDLFVKSKVGEINRRLPPPKTWLSLLYSGTKLFDTQLGFKDVLRTSNA